MTCAASLDDFDCVEGPVDQFGLWKAIYLGSTRMPDQASPSDFSFVALQLGSYRFRSCKPKCDRRYGKAICMTGIFAGGLLFASLGVFLIKTIEFEQNC